jgi:hypothetical protein
MVENCPWPAPKSRDLAATCPAIPEFSNIHRDPPRLVLREQLRRRSPARLILEIDIRQPLPGAVDHDKARIQFID